MNKKIKIFKYCFVKIIWANNNGILYIYCQHKNIFRDIVRYKNNYSKYDNKEYNIEDIIIESINLVILSSKQ
jgi:hypothetical protein